VLSVETIVNGLVEIHGSRFHPPKFGFYFFHIFFSMLFKNHFIASLEQLMSLISCIVKHVHPPVTNIS